MVNGTQLRKNRMLRLEMTDKFGGPDKWVIVSTAKKVEDQKKELEPARVLGMVAVSNIRLIHLQRGRWAVQFFPQSPKIKESMARLCIQLNDEQEADARHKRAENL